MRAASAGINFSATPRCTSSVSIELQTDGEPAAASRRVGVELERLWREAGVQAPVLSYAIWRAPAAGVSGSTIM